MEWKGGSYVLSSLCDSTTGNTAAAEAADECCSDEEQNTRKILVREAET